MPQFCKKPVVIDAVQFNGDNFNEIADFIGQTKPLFNPIQKKMFIRTREGEMTADAGDWIIKGIAGEFYPCKPEIFEATYETVGE